MTPQETILAAARTVALNSTRNGQETLSQLLYGLLAQLEWRPIRTMTQANVVVELLALPTREHPEPALYAAKFIPDYGWSVTLDRRVTHWRPFVLPRKGAES